jgi:hypothetical protein
MVIIKMNTSSKNVTFPLLDRLEALIAWDHIELGLVFELMIAGFCLGILLSCF